MKLQRRYALLPTLAVSLILAACGGGDGEGDSGTGSGGDSGTGTQTSWKEYKTISPRCSMNEGGRNFQQADIYCLRGVFRGKLMYEDRLCEIDFMGMDGFTMTVAGRSYTYAPENTPKLTEYRHYSYTDHSLYYIGSDILRASLDWQMPRLGFHVLFQMRDGKYDAHYYERPDIYSSPASFSTIGFHRMPDEMKNALNIDEGGSTCVIGSVLYH